MQLKDFFYYPHIISRTWCMSRYQWVGSGEPDDNPTLFKRIWYILGGTQMIYQNIGMVANLIVALQQEMNKTEFVTLLAETVSVMTLTLVATCNMWMMVYYRSEIEDLASEMQSIFPSDCDQKYMNRVTWHYTKSSLHMKIITNYWVFGILSYNAIPIMIMAYEYYMGQELSYIIQSKTWYPWQAVTALNSKLSFLASYFCQMQSSTVATFYIIAGQFLLCIFIRQLQIHFDIMTMTLTDMDASNPESNNRLKELIVLHTKVLRMADRINRIFNFTFLLNLATSSFALCMIIYSMTVISRLNAARYTTGLIGFLMYTFFTCYVGTNFTYANDQLLPAAFYNNWYNGNIAYRKMLLLFMLRASESRILRAYQFTPLSMETFMNILKFSYQLFACMQTMA